MVLRGAAQVLERTFRVTQLEDVHPVAGMLSEASTSANGAHLDKISVVDSFLQK